MIQRGSPNTLIFQIQPNEGIFLRLGTKRPGMRFVVEDVKMVFVFGRGMVLCQKLMNVYF